MNKSIYRYFFIYIGIVLFLGLVFLIAGTQLMIERTQEYTSVAYSKTQHGIVESVFEQEKKLLSLLLQDYAVWDDLYYNIETKNYNWSQENATKFLLEDQSGYEIDLVYLFGTNNDYSEAYGDLEILRKIKESAMFSETMKTNAIWNDYMLIDDRLFLLAMSPVTTNNRKMSNGFYFIAKEYTDDDVALLVSQYSNKNEYYGLEKTLTPSDVVTEVEFVLKSENGELITSYSFYYNLEGYYHTYSKLQIHILSIILLIVLAIMIGMNQARKQVNMGKVEIRKRLQNLINGNNDVIYGASKYGEIQEIINHVNELAVSLELRDKMTLGHHMDTMTVIIDAIEEKDEYTKGHSRRVMKIASVIAANMATVDVKLLKEAALLHDIGKISLPSHILNKPGELTSEEYEIVKTHPNRGEWMINGIPCLENIGEIIRQHHERVDGTGYPDGLIGENINLLSRIITLADSFDAMTSNRAYRQKFEFYQAVSLIKKERGKHFDESIVASFLESLQAIRLIVIDEDISA